MELVCWFLVWNGLGFIFGRGNSFKKCDDRWNLRKSIYIYIICQDPSFKHLLHKAGPVHFAGVVMNTSGVENALGHGDEQQIRMTQWHYYVVKLKVFACSKCSSMQSTTFDEVGNPWHIRRQMLCVGISPSIHLSESFRVHVCRQKSSCTFLQSFSIHLEPFVAAITSELTVKHGPPASTVSSTTDPGKNKREGQPLPRQTVTTLQYAKGINPKNNHGEKDRTCLQVSHKNKRI